MIITIAEYNDRLFSMVALTKKALRSFNSVMVRISLM